MDENEQLLEQVAAHARRRAQGHGKPLPAPLEAGARAEAERILGFALPPLLAGLYARVGDGGFGPERGLLPLRESAAVYGAMRASGWRWPAGVLPLCGMYVCVDCQSGAAQVLLFEPNLGEPDLAWFVDAPSLADWLRGWVDGTAWYCEDSGAGEGYDLELTPWSGFRSRA